MELLERAPAPPATDRATADSGDGGEQLTPQERIERSPAGRRVLGTLLAFVVAVVLAWNLPPSRLREALLPVVQPAVGVLGLEQRWNLFAPNPPQRTYQVVARITYVDGSLALWEPPANDRWRKWLGAVRVNQNRALLAPTASWIARHHDGAERGAVRVEMIRRWRDLPPPGNPVVELPWQEEIFFTYVVPPGGDR